MKHHVKNIKIIMPAKKRERRTVVLCLSSFQREDGFVFEEVLSKHLPCTLIHSISYENGVLFAVKLKNQMEVSTISKRMKSVDAEITSVSGVSRANFTKIDLAKGVFFKTFSFDDCEEDKHFRAIFSTPGLRTGGKMLEVWDGVVTWGEEGGVVVEKRAEKRRMREEDDDDNDGLIAENVALGNQVEVLTAEKVALEKQIESLKADLALIHRLN